MCRERAGLWELITDLLRTPDAELVDAVRDGSFAERLQGSTTWLGADSGRFLDSELTLGALARRSARIPRAHDEQELREEHERVFLDPTHERTPEREQRREAVRTLAGQLAERCQQEATAWDAVDHAAASALRRQEQELLESEAVPTWPAWAEEVEQSARKPFLRAAIRCVVSTLSVETGRDFDRTVFDQGLVFDFD